MGSQRTGMCPHCGRIVRVTKGGLTYRHLSDDEHGRTIVPCPGARQNPRCAESDRRPLWNGQPNPHISTPATARIEEHDRCPSIEWLDLNPAIDSLEDWGVEVVDLDGISYVGEFRRITQRGEEMDVGPGWPKPDKYMVGIYDSITGEQVMATDFRNLRTVKVL